MTTAEKIAVMQAYIDGKKIEYYYGTSQWKECIVEPSWDWSSCAYRIKPEPKYRPYKDADECFKEVQKHEGWAKETKSGLYFVCTSIKNCGYVLGGNTYKDYKELVNNYVWADDDTPCGILEE